MRAIAGVLCGLSIVSLAAAALAGDRPNVILFLSDDQGYGDLGYHGNPQAQTPAMDAFARQAVEWTQFYVSPVCAPTRASLMTGRWSFRSGVCDVFGKACWMDPAEVTIADALHRSGYATGIFGKWHLGDDAEHAPGRRGFDETLVHRGPAMRRYFDPILLHQGQEKQFSGYCTDIFVDHAIDFVRRNRSRPFFLYLPTNLIHTPLIVADEAKRAFAARGLDDKTAAIYAMLKNVDDNFGRLLAELARLGLDDNTLVILLADNGPCAGSTTAQRFMAGLRGLKGTVYENGIRVGCFMRWPKGFAGARKIDRIAANIDIMPTVLAACEAERPKQVTLDGVNLLPLLRNSSAAWPDRTLFFQWDSGQEARRGHAFAVRNQRYKLVQANGMDAPNQKHIRDRYAELCRWQGRGDLTIEGPPRYELFDIASDPGETKDLAAECPEIVAEMRKQYEAWFDTTWTRRRGADRPKTVEGAQPAN